MRPARHVLYAIRTDEGGMKGIHTHFEFFKQRTTRKKIIYWVS